MTPHPAPPDLDQLGGQSLAGVLQSLLRLPASAAIPGAPPGFDGPRITAAIPLAGAAVDATVFLTASTAFLSRAAATLLGASPSAPPPDPLLEDFAGELCNLVSGRVAAGLREHGLACSLGIPRILREHGDPPAPGAGVHHGRAGWSWEGQPIAVEIYCRLT